MPGVVDLSVHPLTPDRWPDFEKLFRPRGAYTSCWCMSFRLRRKDWDSTRGPERKETMQHLVASGEPQGLLAYIDGETVGWCSVSPRSQYERIERSRSMAKLPGEGVWAIVCFVIDARYRRQGVMTCLLEAAIDYTKKHGARVIEAYPIEPEGALESYHGYSGIVSTFRRAGFVEVASRAQGRPIMRYAIPT